MSGACWSAPEAETIRKAAAAGKSPEQVAALVGRTRRAVIGFAWRNKIEWKERVPVDPKDSVPDDFARLYYERSYKELCFTYSRSVSTIKKWAMKLALPRKRVAKPKAPRIRKPAQYTPRTARIERPVFQIGVKPFRPHRDESPAGQAADFLRRDGALIRCNERGQYQQNGAFWLRGHTLLSAQDVIDRAQRKGWRPMEVAA